MHQHILSLPPLPVSVEEEEEEEAAAAAALPKPSWWRPLLKTLLMGKWCHLVQNKHQIPSKTVHLHLSSDLVLHALLLRIKSLMEQKHKCDLSHVKSLYCFKSIWNYCFLIPILFLKRLWYILRFVDACSTSGIFDCHLTLGNKELKEFAQEKLNYIHIISSQSKVNFQILQ